MADNLNNASQNDKVNPSVYNDGNQNIFGFIHENPDAKVIINRGSNFEQDITEWVMSFSTSNSVDDIAGSFNVVVNNENDRFVDRYNNVKIATASSVEIFAKISNAPKGIVDSRPATNSDIFQVSEQLLASWGGTSSLQIKSELALNNIIDHYYGTSTPKESRDEYRAKIQELNARKTVSYETMEDEASSEMFGDAVVAVDSNGKTIDKAIWIRSGGPSTIVDADTQEVVLVGGGRGSVVSASSFFTGEAAKKAGREGQSSFYITDLEIETDGEGGFVRRKNGQYQFNMYMVEGSNTMYPAIRQEVSNAKLKNGDFAGTVFRPVVKSKDVPFMLDERGHPLGDIILQVGDMIRVPKPNTDYRRIFFGVVTNISQSISPAGTMTISLNGKSIGYWLEASVINVQPAVEENQYQTVDLSFFANRYAESSALDIFRDLIRFSTDDLVAVSDYSLDTNATATDYLLIEGQNGDIATDPQGRVLTSMVDENGRTAAMKYNSNPARKEEQLNRSEEQLYENATPISSNFAKPSDNADRKAWVQKSSEYRANKADIARIQVKIDKLREESVGLTGKPLEANQKKLEEQEKKQSELTRKNDDLRTEMSKIPLVEVQLKTLAHNKEENQKQWANQIRGGREKLLDEFGITKHWQRIFAKIILEVLDSSDVNGKKGFLANVYPFRWDVRAPGWMDGDYQSKADIGRTIAQNLMYEFYFDTNGHFVLKPPLYSISQQDNDADYILTDMDVYSININDTIDGIISRIGVAGAFFESPTTPKEMIYSVFQDFNLIKNYGVHSRELNNLLFIRNNSDCRSFGRAFMSKNNVELKNATVTIYGRPEIRLGTSIYLKPRDTVYYIKGISHDFNVGDGITTTLTLVGARRVIRGFLAKKKVSEYEKKLKADGTFEVFKKGGDNSLEIEHYVPINATNFTDLPLSSQPQVNDAINRQLNADNSNQNADTISDSRVVLLQEVFMITSHPNISLIGLLVDQKSVLLNQINQNYYEFLMNLTQYAENNLRTGTNELSPSNKVLIFPAAKKLTEIFEVFVGLVPPKTLSPEGMLKEYGFGLESIVHLTAFPMGSDFYYNYLSFFITSQYKRIAAQVQDKKIVSNRLEYNLLDIQRTLLDLINRDIDTFGSYMQYTDSYAREMPSYVDFGKSMTIYQTDVALNSSEFNSNNQNAKKTERERTIKAAKAANKALGTNAKKVQATPGKSNVATSQNKAVQESQPQRPAIDTAGVLNSNMTITAQSAMLPGTQIPQTAPPPPIKVGP